MAIFDGGRDRSVYLGDGDVGGGGGGMGRIRPNPASSFSVKESAQPRGKKKAIEQHTPFTNRRGLLLSMEQLQGPAAPNYLLRKPNVYSSQSLL